MDNLNVYDIQRFSLNDGPGIRTTIFLKGCNLKCSWCHNPESIYMKSQLAFDRSKCDLCGKCIDVDKSIIIQNEELVIDLSKNNRNFKLIDTCPTNAFYKIGENKSVQDILLEIEKDKAYYETSGGGVTISGGEALLQIEPLIDLLKELKSKGYNICLDVNGRTNIQHLLKTVDYVDNYLVDFKLLEEKKQIKYLGAQLNYDEVLRALNDNSKKMILRCPVIPGLNLTRSHFQEIKRLQDAFSQIYQIDILPYHNMKKRQEFKRYNAYKEFDLLTDIDKSKIYSLCKSLGIKNVYYSGRDLIND